MTTLTANLIADLERRRRAEQKRAHAVARVQFTYKDTSIGDVTIARGEIVYDLDHPAVRARPDAFMIVGPKRTPASRPELNAPNAGTAHRRDEEELARPSWALPCGEGLLVAGDVERRAGTSPIRVSLSRLTRDDIARYARRVPSGFETGGLLFAGRARGTDAIELLEAWGPGPSAHLRRNSMAIDWRCEHSRARRLLLSSDHQIVPAGCWHVHPGGTDEPSTVDLRMWRAAWAHASENVWPMRHYLGIIATEVDRSRVNLTAWIVRETRARTVICERAVIA